MTVMSEPSWVLLPGVLLPAEVAARLAEVCVHAE
jgi:hypothetical protein